MFENKFDKALDEVGAENGLDWNDDSKIRLFARFLGEHHPELFQEFEKFLTNQADEELDDIEEDEEESEDEQDE